ncbi:MAG TPA: tRNA preQ1(34) S-adenosylmethionine ribosyltransferase-isomerase QueA [Spirochaetota bacterium]|nr:tRNA preQ1(34) S-adenosylmethionine ribosyltransferase-isomerase QueA [Spirochaetota bacterium]HQO39046.1 tRNA preQ1(34) S-adenosylmethionine ribosyltransferase-isomerase QueA [Spirochaetota bacterium]
MPQKKTPYSLQDFIYDLPEELVAQVPSPGRDSSRLFVLDRGSGKSTHTMFSSIPGYLRPGDILVFNNARVINARIFCRRETGGRVEVVLAENLGPLSWKIICNRTARIRSGDRLRPEQDPSIFLEVTGREGEYLIVETSVPLDPGLLERIGVVPLPPYIRREADRADSERYQTVYAAKSGAVAAPTAGLHFTHGILESLKSMGITMVFTTLFVSWGTFSPVRENDLSLHKMHSEKYILDPGSAAVINSGRKSGRRIVAVGTTALRVLESTFRDGENVPGEGATDIFIYPPCQIKSADALLTNLHTPGSTLLMLVCAFAGYETVMAAYGAAVREGYRFFSYGDAMLII